MMFKVKVFTIGRCKEAWLASAIAEYEKRLSGRLAFEWRFAKDHAQLIAWTKREPHAIALDPKGELFTSQAWCENTMKLGSNWIFVIGGAEGLPPSILAQPRRIWSLSPLTFTHQIARLILVEQLYRSMEIERGSPYHK